MNLRCKPKPDVMQAAYYGKNPELKAICFPAQAESNFYMPEIGICPMCHQETGTRVCPNCHNTLPSTIDINNDIMLSVIGAKDSGKSSYLGVLMHEIKQRFATSLNGAASLMDKENMLEYERRYGQYLYPSNAGGMPTRIVPVSFRGMENTNMGENRPILCDMKLQKKNFFNQITIPYTFIFYDSIGEIFENQEAMFTMSRHISKSKGIVFLIDPLQIPKVRTMLTRQEIKGASNISGSKGNSAAEVLLRVVNLIRAQNRVMESKKIPIPIVVVVSKIDVIKELLPANLWTLRESPHLAMGAYDEQDGWNVKEEVYGILHEWGQQDFLKYLEFNFSNVQLCACSSFGNNPNEQGKIQIPRPHRMEDGLLWLLKELNVLESSS